MIQHLSHLIYNHALHNVMIGTMIIGITSGLLGVFTFLRKQSLLGDAISHAALPGVSAMFLLTHSQQPMVLFLGGFIAGIIGTVFVHVICRTTKLKKDAALGIVLSVFFGLGLVLLTVVQKVPVVGQAFLHRFLFGDASTLLYQDIYFSACVSGIVCIVTLLFWKEFKLISFDPLFARTIGYSVGSLELLLTVLLVTAIVVGLQMVGVILMSALLIASAVAARQWTNTIEYMALLSVICGGLSCALGSLVSCTLDNIPTGPAIVVIASTFVALSFMGGKVKGAIQRN